MSAAAPRITFVASVPEVVVDHDARRAAGLFHWVDGTMGIARPMGGTVVMAPNGRRSSRHRGSPDDLLGGLETTDQPIVAPREHADHASGGPLLVHPDGRRLLLAYHAERFRDGDPTRFWSFIGLAVSDDGGRSFVDRGCVLTSQVPEDSDDLPVEVGPGSLVVVGEWLHLYFVDRGDRTRRVHLGVARARLVDVWEAVEGGDAPRFEKLWLGRFCEPAVGGRATDLLPEPPLPVVWMDVGRLGPEGPLVCVHSSVARVVDREPWWTQSACASWDGTTWSRPRRLHPPRPGELIYVTVDAGAGPSGSFDVYRTASRPGARWAHADLERVTVAWTLDGEPSGGAERTRSVIPDHRASRRSWGRPPGPG